MEETVTVYILRSTGNGKRYVGITNDLSRRLAEHQRGSTKASHILGEFLLIHTETFPNHGLARKREIFLKSGQGRKWLDEKFLAGPAKGG